MIVAYVTGGVAIYLATALELELLPAFALLAPYFACLLTARIATGAGFEAGERMPWWVALVIAVGAALTVPLVVAFDTILPASIWMMVGGAITIFPELVGVRTERRTAPSRPPTGRFRRTGVAAREVAVETERPVREPRSPDN